MSQGSTHSDSSKTDQSYIAPDSSDLKQVGSMSIKKAKSAKQLTFIYFSIVAFSIITFHFALFDLILEDMEQITAQNRLLHDKQIVAQQLQQEFRTDFKVSPFSHVYLNYNDIPNDVGFPKDLPLDSTYEADSEKSILDDINYEYYVMRSIVQVNNQPQIIYLVHFDEIYEQSEEQTFQTQTKQLLLSFTLLCVSLWAVLQISKRLTSPLSHLTKTLAERNVQDLSPIQPPEGVATQEVLQLVQQLNQYQSKIHQLLQRERAFNRYASHELRTPLMVIKGAVSLLGQSQDPAFIDKQRVRLKDASTEMNDFVSTLLSLTREEDISVLTDRVLEEKEITEILDSHQHLLTNKEVSCQIQMQEQISLKMPETSFKILLGNLVKNAFACTDQGQITVTVNQNHISVVDSGIGLGSKPRGVEGFGLGLLIAHDICRKYGWHLELINNEQNGCTARINLHPEPEDLQS